MQTGGRNKFVRSCPNATCYRSVQQRYEISCNPIDTPDFSAIRCFCPGKAFFSLPISTGIRIFACRKRILPMMTDPAPDKQELSPRLILQTTADGSHTFYLPDLDEHYHSVNGAIRESQHVFIEAGWKKRLSRDNRPETLRILEVGFGTGLNAFLTLLEAGSAQQPTLFYTIERFPLNDETVQSLNYSHRIAPERHEDFLALHRAPWNQPVRITPFFILHKLRADCNACTLPDAIDLIYFDAFAPDKQPEMWNQPLFDALFRHTAPGGILATYCAKGVVRRMLQAAGYRTERLPGPPGKREMLRGRKEDHLPPA